MTPDEEPLRDFADRFFRDALRNPENLRELIFSWILNRRPRVERQQWIDLGAATQENEFRQQELKAMITIADEIFSEGQVHHARQILLKVGGKRFGEPPPEVVLNLGTIEDLQRLDRMALRLLEVSTWTELLETM